MSSLGVEAQFTCTAATLNLILALWLLSGQHAAKNIRHMADKVDAERKQAVAKHMGGGRREEGRHKPVSWTGSELCF